MGSAIEGGWAPRRSLHSARADADGCSSRSDDGPAKGGGDTRARVWLFGNAMFVVRPHSPELHRSTEGEEKKRRRNR